MTTSLKDYGKLGPLDALESLSSSETSGFKEFLKEEWTTKEFPQKDAVFPNMFSNLGQFSADDIVDPDEIYDFATDEEGNTPTGTLLQHLPTGYVFALVGDQYPALVFNFKTEQNSPTQIEITTDQRWVKTKIDAAETRVGGTTDFSAEAWPHFEDLPLLFAAQYVLSNGKRIHVFVDDEGESSWEIEDGANCALVEGGPVPSWITLKPVKDTNILLRTPKTAATPIRDSGSGLPLGPLWIQGDEAPNDVNYRFLLQFGDSSSLGNSREMDTMFGDCGDMYLFYKEETNEARVLWQCC